MGLLITNVNLNFKNIKMKLFNYSNYVYKSSVVDLRTFRWIHDKIRKTRVRNKKIIDNLRIMSI